MDLRDFECNGGHAYVVGLPFCFPPKYVTCRLSRPTGWAWTNELTEAETFATKEEALSHMKYGMASLIDGNKDVKILKVTMKVGDMTALVYGNVVLRIEMKVGPA